MYYITRQQDSIGPYIQITDSLDTVHPTAMSPIQEFSTAQEAVTGAIEMRRLWDMELYEDWALPHNIMFEAETLFAGNVVDLIAWGEKESGR